MKKLLFYTILGTVIPFLAVNAEQASPGTTPPVRTAASSSEGRQNEFNAVEMPDEVETRVIKDLQRQIARVQADISRYHKEMKDHNLIDPVKQISRIPMLAEVQTEYGVRGRNVFNEQGLIEWNQDKIVSFTFEQRSGKVNQGYVARKQLKGQTITDPEKMGVNESPLNLVVVELLDSGRGQSVNFRFPTSAEAVDVKEEIEFDGVKREMMVVFVRNVDQRIAILREYLSLLRLLERRIDWVIRAEEQRKALEIERILRIH